MIVDVGSTPLNFDEVLAIASEAGNAILEVYEHEDDWDVQQKDGDAGPVTKADRVANTIICSRLSALTPDVQVVSEENDLPDYSVRKAWEYFWCVDPLDGTKEFIQRHGTFTVNIGLCHRSTVIAGVVLVPVSNEIYWAAKGQGAFCRVGPVGAPVKRLQCSSFSWDQQDLRIASSKNHSNPETLAYINQFSSPRSVPTGSSLKFVLVAGGLIDLYPRLGPTSEWDTCAAQIIVEEAGGRVLQLNQRNQVTADPLMYNKECFLNPNFVAIGVTQPPLGPGNQ